MINADYVAEEEVSPIFEWDDIVYGDDPFKDDLSEIRLATHIGQALNASSTFYCGQVTIR